MSTWRGRNMQVRWIRPKPIPIQKTDQALRFALQRAGEIAKVDYKLFTGTWEQENEPQWKEVKPHKVGRDLVWEYTTTSTPLVYVEEGTKPHLIPKVPKTTGFLRFQTGFIAKTQPGQIASGPGAHFGPFASAKQVQHPGTKPRHIRTTIAEGVLPFLVKFIGEAIRNP